MTVFGLFDTKDLEEFAQRLAADMAQRFPPNSERRTDAGAQHQLKVILEGIGAKAVRYRDEHRLGVYRKAKLGNVFRWKLSDLGYSSGFVELATKDLVTRLAAAGGIRSKSNSK